MTPEADITPGAASLVERLQQRGLRLTAQRRAIAQALDGPDRHVDADTLLVDARAVIPEIGRATVYKALTAFVATGQVGEFTSPAGRTLYDPNAHRPHHHQICDRCGAIRDLFVADDLLALADPAFAPRAAALVLHGLCGPCRAAGPTPPT